MKKALLLVAVVAMLVPLFAVSAAAQKDVRPALSDYMLSPAQPPVMAIPFKPGQQTTPSYCKPCLFYSGDMDPNDSDNNGLFNADDSPLGITAYVYSAFTVPKGKTWTITKLFINTLSNATAVDPTVTWDIRKGVTSGSGGTDVATGTGKQSWAATGRSAFGYSEYTDLVTLKKAQKLKAGTYFLNVWTSCTTSSCNGDLFYESDQEHQPGMNQYPPGKKGEQPWDNSYFNSSSFGYTWAPTWGSSGACGNVGCDSFSDGAVGKVSD